MNLQLLLVSLAISAASHAAMIFSPTVTPTLISTPAPDAPGELVIGIPNFSMKRYNEAVSLINGVNGIKMTHFCDQLDLFLIEYDRSIFASPEEAFQAVAKEMNAFRLFHKVGASHEELKKDC